MKQSDQILIETFWFQQFERVEVDGRTGFQLLDSPVFNHPELSGMLQELDRDSNLPNLMSKTTLQLSGQQTLMLWKSSKISQLPLQKVFLILKLFRNAFYPVFERWLQLGPCASRKNSLSSILEQNYEGYPLWVFSSSTSTKGTSRPLDATKYLRLR